MVVGLVAVAFVADIVDIYESSREWRLGLLGEGDAGGNVLTFIRVASGASVAVQCFH